MSAELPKPIDQIWKEMSPTQRALSVSLAQYDGDFLLKDPLFARSFALLAMNDKDVVAQTIFELELDGVVQTELGDPLEYHPKIQKRIRLHPALVEYLGEQLQRTLEGEGVEQLDVEFL